VIWITIILALVLLGAIFLIYKNPKNVQPKFKNTLDTSFEEDA
jgi:hypothetical protein